MFNDNRWGAFEEFYNEKAHAERSLNSRMDKSKLLTSEFELLPEVEDELERFSLELKLDKKNEHFCSSFLFN